MLAWHRINTLLLLLVLFALVGVIAMLAVRTEGGPLDPSGAPTPTDSVRLPGTPISGPTTISAPGHYYLTRNISITGAVTAVRIDSDDVTLDLGGFAISGDNGFISNGVIVVGPHVRIAIRNGSVRSLSNGISVLNGAHVRIADVIATSSGVGFYLGGDAVLEDCSASANNIGVVIEGPRTVVRRCQVSLNDSSGISVFNTADALIEQSAIKGNNPSNNPPSGGVLLFTSQRVTIRENDFSSNTLADVWVQSGDNHVIIDNSIGCPTSIILAGTISTNVFRPVSPGPTPESNDPHVNRAHNASC